MERIKFLNILVSQLLVMSFVVTGCLPSDVPSTRNLDLAAATTGGAQSGNNAGAGGNTVGNGTTLPPKVEIRHLIEPNLTSDLTYSTGTGYAGGGSYLRKLTIPKNYQGRLYLAGINVGTLADRHVKVRFKFGIGKEPVTIPATVAQAPGITPATAISVLVMDLRSEPFRAVRLPYDLFDYNDYDYADGDTPVQENRNSGLFCRGLRIEDDPTFTGVGVCGDQPSEECLYAYAKVLDQGLVKTSGSVLVPLTPSRPQVKSTVSLNYHQDYLYEHLKKALPDTMAVSGTNTTFKFSALSASTNVTDFRNIDFGFPATLWDPVTLYGSTYHYRGPYRIVNFNDWHFGFAFSDLHGSKKLFKENSFVAYPVASYFPLPDDNQASPFQDRIYYNSYLFPLATRLDLPAGVSHLSSTAVDGVRTEQVLASAGKTLWMDGANARAQSRNYDLEHIGSCNVSATIEIIAKDNNGVDYVIATSREVKLQLVRPTQYRTDTGNEVLYTNFKSCTTNSSCGGSECCFNNRCWDENLVSQCIDENSPQGNRIVGDSCTTDFECTSLCCNRTTGKCAAHNTILTPAVLCSKPIGEFCIAKEWCQKSPITKCLIVKTGTDSSGNTTCRQQCYTTQEFGDCKNGACTPPVQEPIVPVDTTAPGACDNAVPAPSF